MRITDETLNGVAILAIDGDVDALAAPDLADRLASLRAAGRHRIVVDLSRAPFLASAGIRALQEGLAASRREAGDLRVVVSAGLVADTLTRTGAATVLPVFPTLEA